MPTFYSDMNQGSKPAATSASAGVVICQIATCNVPATYAANDIVQLGVLPKYHELVDLRILADRLDSNATDTLRYSVGTLNSAGNGLVAGTEAISGARTDAVKLQPVTDGAAFRTIAKDAVDRVIAARITAGGATRAAGKMTAYLTYRAVDSGM